MQARLGFGIVLTTILVTAWAIASSKTWTRQDDRLPVLADVTELSLRDHLDRSFTRESLVGRVHVVNFLFTSCEATCPLLVRQMQEVERNTRALGDRVRFLSISVDPETDTPTVLRRYVDKRGLDTRRWLFLTGPLDAVERAVVGAFQSPMGKQVHPAEGDVPTLVEITHGENFVVVDAEGRIRALHHARSEADVAAIVATVEKLLAESTETVVGQR